MLNLIFKNNTLLERGKTYSTVRRLNPTSGDVGLFSSPNAVCFLSLEQIAYCLSVKLSLVLNSADNAHSYLTIESAPLLGASCALQLIADSHMGRTGETRSIQAGEAALSSSHESE